MEVWNIRCCPYDHVPVEYSRGCGPTTRFWVQFSGPGLRKVDKYGFEPLNQIIPSISAMRLLLFLLSAVVALHSAVGASTGKQRRFTPNGATPTVLTPEFVETVQEIVSAEGIPGLTLAFVNLTGPPELGTWGIKSENGANMTTDVSLLLGGFKCTDATVVCLADIVQYCRLVKGLPLRLSRDSDQRLCIWT
jgi:hypothetical protein